MDWRKWARFWGCVILLLYGDLAYTQNTTYTNNVVTQWSMSEGLPQSSVNDVLQSQDGYLWLATFGGLVRFDGVSFTTFNRSNTEGMRSDRILHFYEDTDGVLWLSTENGFLRFEDGICKPYLIYDDTQLYSPSYITQDDYGRMWLTAYGYPFRYDAEADTLIKVTVSRDEALKQQALEDTSGVWLVPDDQIMKTYGDSVVFLDDLRDRLENHIADFAEYPEGSGTLFLGSTGDGVIRYQEGELQQYSVESGLPSRYVTRVDRDRSNNLWVTNYNGVSRWDGDSERFVPLQAVSAGKERQYSMIYEDREDNYWIGTPNDGLFRVRPSQITSITKEQGLETDQMLSLTELRDGSKLFATNCGGVYEWDGRMATPSKINDYLPNLCVWSVFEDSNEQIWFGSRVLYRSNSLNEPGQIFGSDDGFTGQEVFAITEDSEGNIWIGCYNGLYKYDGNQFRKYSVADGLTYNDTRVLYEDTEGVMWVGTSQGLNTITDGKISHVDLQVGLSDSTGTKRPYVRAIYEDENGIMWLGTYGHGIFRLKNGQVDQITKQDGLFDNIVSHIVEDDHGNFWMGSNRGIFRVKREALNALVEGEIKEVSSISYGTSDGMATAETNGGFQPNVIFDDDGRLYVPTVKGVAVVSTNLINQHPQAPRTYIDKIMSGTEELPLNDDINLPYDNAYLKIDYTAPNFRDPDKTQFRYRLKGLNNNWFDVGTDRSALYTKIPPGEFTFYVQAKNSYGIWDDTPASLRIAVASPFWQTRWFYGLTALLLFSLGGSIYYYRVRQLTLDNERQKRFTEQLIESQEKERRRIASELHDGLGQQILVIKNRAELANLQPNNPDVTEDQLQEILLSAQRSITDVRNISHGLRPVHLEKFGLTEALERLCEQLMNTSDINWSYHIENIDHIFPNDKDINFFRVIQEGSKNILRHSKATEASIFVQRNDGQITVKLSDNGQGFDVAELETGTGLGFKGMKERIVLMGGTLQISSSAEKGTLITIQIPIA
jgi:signal transduction histidine kinase/ligand-binding sensor domain-containing protein